MASKYLHKIRVRKISIGLVLMVESDAFINLGFNAHLVEGFGEFQMTQTSLTLINNDESAFIAIARMMHELGKFRNFFDFFLIS